MNLAYLIASLVASTVSAAVAIYVWRQQSIVAAKTLVVLLAASTLWVLCSGVHELMSTLPTKILISKIQYLGIVVVPVTMLIFSLQYTGHEERVSRGLIGSLMVIPAIIIALVWTNSFHQLFWSEIRWLNEVGGSVEYRYGPLFWVWITYAYAALATGTFLLIRFLQESTELYRSQIVILMLAIAAPWIGNILYLLRLSPWPTVDTTAFGFIITGIAMSWGVLRLQMSNIIPVARQSILKSISESIFVLDSRGYIIDLNSPAEELISGSMSDTVGRRYDYVFQRFPSLQVVLEEAIDKAQFGKNIEINLGEISQPNFQNLSVSPVINEKDNFLGMLMELRDVNDMKQAAEERLELESQLQQSQKLESLGIMAGGIAHDFNNLLMGISGNAELARRSVGVDSPASINLEEIESITSRAAALCQQLLAYSGKGRFDIRNLNINEIIEDMVKILAHTAPKNIYLECRLSDTLPLVRADSAQIQQLVMNVALNATEAVEKSSGTVTLVTEVRTFDSAFIDTLDIGSDLPPGDYVMLKVSDTGRGMDEETRLRIFDPFFSTKFTGRGLGMSAVLGIIQGHGGGLKVASTVNKGTDFLILLPFAEGKSAEQSLLNAVSPARSGSAQRRTILVVDDEEFILDVTTALLKELEFSTLTACDGVEAIKVWELNADEIDCLLMDLSMPEMDGEACYRQLRQSGCEVPMIIMSGYHEKEVSHKFSTDEGVRFLHKPFNASQLEATIEALFK